LSDRGIITGMHMAEGAGVAADADLSATQARLVRTGYQVFSEKGIAGTSLQEVAERAEVSKGLILYHFESKERFALATMEWALTGTADRIRGSIDPAASPAKRISAMLGAIFHSADSNRRFYLAYLDLLGLAARVDRFGQVNDTFRTIVNALYRDVISQGVAEGVFEVDDLDEAADAVRAIIDGSFLVWLQEADWKGAHRRYRDRCERTILGYLGCP